MQERLSQAFSDTVTRSKVLLGNRGPIKHIDDQIGEFMGFIVAQRLIEETMIIFTSRLA